MDWSGWWGRGASGTRAKQTTGNTLHQAKIQRSSPPLFHPFQCLRRGEDFCKHSLCRWIVYWGSDTSEQSVCGGHSQRLRKKLKVYGGGRASLVMGDHEKEAQETWGTRKQVFGRWRSLEAEERGAVLPNLTPPRIWPPPVKLGKRGLPGLVSPCQIRQTASA